MKFALLLCLVGLAMAGPLNKSFNKFGVNLSEMGGEYIVGGSPATDGQAPYQVSLQQSRHFCGGTIVSKDWIVTAAHCVDGLAASALKIRYNTLTHNSGGSLVQAAQIISHEQYDSYNIDHDIAIIKLASSLTLDQTNAKSVPLTSQGNDPADGASAIISGWGSTKEGGSGSTALQIVTVPIVSRAQCNTNYGSGRITENMFCAGLAAGGKDACQGDSGGPVVVNGELVGAVSWGRGCARPNYPGVYTRVGNYLTWMKEKGLTV